MLRKTLSAPGLLNVVKKSFEKLPDTIRSKKGIALTDCLMSGLAIFGLKFPSLLQFDYSKEEACLKHNLKKLYQINQIPSDTYLRERLDAIDPLLLRKPFKKIFAQLQRGNALEQFSYIDEHYLLALDGTGYFNSYKVHCSSCCEKKYKDGSLAYYHNMLGAVLINPDFKEVIPLPPEPILQQDGHNKNDCEQNASKRLVEHVRREHPHLKLIVVEDALSATGPHVMLLRQNKMKFIIGCKNNYDYLFKHRQDLVTEYKTIDADGTQHCYRFANDIPLNGSHLDIKINVLDYIQISPSGKKNRFTWITDLPLTKSTVYKIMKGGRARWKIENETFNTLKNQGYHFEHNYGHGNKHLTTVFAYLMMLAFLIDQVQQLCCKLFKAALNFLKRKISLWERVRAYFSICYLESWDELYNAIAYQKVNVLLDTS
ncbi:MAG: transposase [Ferruginibacter sp.]